MHALVVTGYHEKEAEFGHDVTQYYEGRGLGSDRHIDFYAVRDNQGSSVVATPKVDEEIRAYVASRNPPDLILDVHVGAADLFGKPRRIDESYEAIDIDCKCVPRPVVYRLCQVLGQEHVFSDIVFPRELEEPPELASAHGMAESEESFEQEFDETIAQTGLPTIIVEPYLFMKSVTSKDRCYWKRVRQTARLINTVYDAFESHGTQLPPPGD